MKKLIFVFVAMAAVSCGSTNNGAATDSDSVAVDTVVAVEDTVDTVADSTAATDSVVAA